MQNETIDNERRRRLDYRSRRRAHPLIYDSTFPTINEGEVVHGKVVRVDKDEVLVDIGYKSEGVIPVAELSIRRSINPADEVALGDEIDALVLTKEDAEGRLILSKKRARFELAWKAIEQAAESGQPVTGKVIEVVKGGLILDLGVRGFLPASLVDIRRVQDLDEFLAKELRCKVIELNRSRNNVVLSRRAVLEDERKEMRQAILDRLAPGDVVEGQISNIVDFGAFVDLDGMDGLIHISELSWSHVNHPSEVLEIGQTVKVKVLDIDRDRQRISLGLKQTQTDPWQQVLDSYGEGDVVQGRVTKVVTFGAFVEILPGVEGLVHISELAQHHVENPREVVSQGDLVNVKIIEVDAERRRLSLSLKRIEDDGQPQPRREDGELLRPQIDLCRGGLRRRCCRRARRGGCRAGGGGRRAGRGGCRAGGGGRRAGDAGGRARGSRRGIGRAGGRAAADDRLGHDGRNSAGPGRPALLAGLVAPLTVAVTGGIGAGKSAALAAFARRGVPTLSADHVVHRLIGEDPGCAPHSRSASERPTGPASPRSSSPIASSSTGWRRCSTPASGASRKRGSRVSMRRSPRSEIPLLFETGGEERFDAVVVITAPADVRARRTGRAGDARAARLLSDPEKVRRADFAYVNEGTLDELDAFVGQVLDRLTG